MKTSEKLFNNPFRSFQKNRTDLERELTDLVKERVTVSGLWGPPEDLIEKRHAFFDSLIDQFGQALANPSDDLFGYRSQPFTSLEHAAAFIAFAADRDELKKKVETAIRKNYPRTFATDDEKRARLLKIDERVKEISRALVTIYEESESANVDVLPNENIHPGIYLGLE